MNEQAASTFNIRNHAGLLILLTTYIVYYAALILSGHGLPYVMDNNETFSSLNHAYNLWNFDFFRSFGLADEAASPDALAHPVVHTHQGNFPRLFSFVLFALGARTAESQIWITTFTIGIASVAMAHTFLRRIGGELFATIAVLVLITDYLMFAQWQVNTYRVWHGFFLFAALLCVHGLGEWKRRNWVAATIALYACLFYWELVFVAFVSITVGLYTLWLYRRAPRRVLLGWTVQGFGAVIGLSAVIGQLILYLGWADFLTDIRLTTTARNNAPGMAASGDFLGQLRSFYETRNLVFLYNIDSGRGHIDIVAFLRSFFQNILQIPTPLVGVSAIGLAGAALLADSRPPSLSRIRSGGPNAPGGTIAILAPGVFIMMVALVAGDAVRGATLPAVTGTFDEVGAAITVGLGLSVVLAYGLARLASAISPFDIPATYSRCFRASLFLTGFAALILLQGWLYDPTALSLWLGSLTPLPEWAAKLLMGAVAVAGALTILAGRRATLGKWHHVPSSIAPFLLCGAIAYACIYVLSSGYLRSGYLVRLAPMPVFHFDTLIGLGVFVGIASTVALASRSASRRRRELVWVSTIAGLAALTIAASWSVVQIRYYRLMPPDRLGFINMLKQREFRASGIVTNAYAAPFGFVAETWAYGFLNVSNLIADAPSPIQSGPYFPYVWLADRSDPAYWRPDLYVCFAAVPSLPHLITELSPLEVPRGCSLADLDRLLRNPVARRIVEADVLARDAAEDRWAIVRLRWLDR